MIRTGSPRRNSSRGCAAFAVSVGLVGCSASPTSTGSGTGSAGTDQSSNASSGSTAAAASGGAAGAGGQNSGPGGGSTGASGAGSGGASSGRPATSSGSGAGTGAVMDSGVGGTRLGSVAGCGQGTSCTPGNDLAPPSAGQGFQIATPANGITVQPGQEAFLCYYKTVPNTGAVDIGTFQSWMTPGSSHHFIAYQMAPGGLGSQADGALVSCQFGGGGTWVYATSLPGVIVEMKMPSGVGLPLAAGSQIMLNMHFINPGSTPVSPQVKMNVVYAQNVQYKAAAMTSFNAQINVPPATAAGPGTQTVQGTCTAPVGSNFFIVTSHTHKHATLAEVNYVSGGQTHNLVHTTDWEHPDARMWPGPTFLTIGSGDSFTYDCSYSNTGSSAVTVGETAASNEMCMAIAYYFPAGSTSCK